MDLYGKQSELIENIREEIRTLEEKQFELNKLITEKYSKINEIIDSNFFDSTLLIKSIEYLVSLVEKEKYKIEDASNDKQSKYEIKYLVKENGNDEEKTILRFKNNSDKAALLEIYNKEFDYISDYIDTLINYKLENNFQITSDDTKQIANKFSESYRIKKSLALVYGKNIK